MTDEQKAQAAAAAERRRLIGMAREALDIGSLEQRLADLPDEVAQNYQLRPWLEAIRAGVSALSMPPEPTPIAPLDEQEG